MTRLTSLGFAILLMLNAALAQQPPATSPTPGEPQRVFTPTINLTVEQRHVIREIVKDVRVEPAPREVDVTVGAAVPETVTLTPMPALAAQKVPQVWAHRFFLAGGRIAIVDPKDRTIAEVIE